MLKSVRSLKAELSACLRRVQEGEECHITSHQQVIAKIIPMQSPITTEQLNRENFVKELSMNMITSKKGETPLSKIIIQQRQNERY